MTKRLGLLKKYGKYSIAGAIFFLLVITLLIFHFGPRIFYRYFGHLLLDKVETRLSEKQIRQIQEGVSGLKAKVVFSSSRTGNHEIFMLTLPEIQTYQLTHHPHVNYFPRFSPDGEKIIFARSQITWVSERDEDPWDVYLLSLQTGKETLLARDANYPQWVDTGRISFSRKNKVIIKDLGTGHEKIILDGMESPISGSVGTPEFSPKDPRFLVLTTRGKLDGVIFWDLLKRQYFLFGGGCEITWFPQGNEVLWVENGGNGGTQMPRSSATHDNKTLFMDLPGEFSHEYFPRLSRDGKWLVWGASSGGHEHDLADYEIFLWKVGTPFSRAVRLTYSPANERWPDIFIMPKQ